MKGGALPARSSAAAGNPEERRQGERADERMSGRADEWEIGGMGEWASR